MYNTIIPLVDLRRRFQELEKGLMIVWNIVLGVRVLYCGCGG